MIISNTDPGASQLVSQNVTSQQPVLQIPQQELTLIKKGLDKYFLELRKMHITVNAPFMDDDYFYVGFWNDDPVEAVVGRAVATSCIAERGGRRAGRWRPSQPTTCSASSGT